MRAIVTVLLLLAAASPARAANPVVLADFAGLSPGPIPTAVFREMVPGRARAQTRFSLVTDEGRTVLRMESDASASALARDQRADPRALPLLTWSWKVTRLVEGADLTRRAGDDFPARLYVFFDYDINRLPLGQRTRLGIARALHGTDLPLAALCYVWDTRGAVGTIAPNAYTDRVRMIVVESGPGKLGRWVTVERNVFEDFRAAFGEEPPAITGIAVAADTDDTGERALSFFGDIVLRPAGTGK